MAHYAFLDENNIVTEVIVGNDEGTGGKTGEEWEAYYGSIREQVCKRTSYNRTIRKNYASIGYKYDHELDFFISPQPYASWSLDTETGQWIAPIPMPTDGKFYSWDEETTSWKEVEQ